MNRVLGVLVVMSFSGCPQPMTSLDGGVDGGPDCPEVSDLGQLDLGCVARGVVASRRLPDAGVPWFAVGSPAFDVVRDELRFTPSEARDYRATLVAWRGTCALAKLGVRGNGVESSFWWSPESLDFGRLATGRTLTRELTFRSCTFSSTPLGNASTSASVFSVVRDGGLVIPAAVRDETGVIVPGELPVAIAFAPSGLSVTQAFFSAETGLVTQPSVTIVLRGVGGGPIAELTPAQLDFGAVAGPTTRQVTLRNVGDRVAPADPSANLFLGVDGGQPYFELTPASCGTVTLSSPYGPSLGLSTTDALTFDVTLQPAAGPRRCELRVFTSDPLTPEPVVVITAQ